MTVVELSMATEDQVTSHAQTSLANTLCTPEHNP
jgi:hypothetical protein